MKFVSLLLATFLSSAAFAIDLKTACQVPDEDVKRIYIGYVKALAGDEDANITEAEFRGATELMKQNPDLKDQILETIGAGEDADKTHEMIAIDVLATLRSYCKSHGH